MIASYIGIPRSESWSDKKNTQKITIIRKHGEELHRQIDIIIDKLSSKLMVTVPNFTPHKMNKEHLHQQLVYLS